MSESEKQFPLTRAALTTCGRAKSKFLSVQETKSPKRKTRRAYWFAGLLVATLLLGGSAARAQYTDNYQTNIIDNVVSSWPGEYDIGNGYYSDVLIITNAGQLFNGDGYLGLNAGDNNNVVTVTSAGSVWSSSARLVVGYSGVGNTLTIANGGTVHDAYCLIGVAGVSNAVTVTGAGSVWNNGDELDVGRGSSGNTLTIANGGTVYDAYCYIGYNYSINNAVTVTGTGSVWSNSDIVMVGVYGGGQHVDHQQRRYGV